VLLAPPGFRPQRNDVAAEEALQKTRLDQAPNPRPQGNDVTTDEALPKTLLDHAPNPRSQGNDVGTDEALLKTLLDQEPEPRPVRDVATSAGQAVAGAPDEVQAAPPNIPEREARQTLGIASIIRAADAAHNTLPPISERKDTAITMSLDALSVVMVIVVAALGLISFLLRRTYAKRVLAFGATHLSQPPIDNVRPVLSWPPRNQVEADPSASVKKALDTIEEAVAEMASSRQLRSVRR
jgi:hypothetical protein